MKFNKYVPLLFALAILGCTSGSTSGAGFSQTSGAVINDFSFDANQVDDATGQTVLTLTYQNVGGKTMSGTTYTYVYGAPITTAARSSTSSTAPTGDDRKWLVDDSGGGTKDIPNQRITYTDTSTNFMPPNPTTGQPGMSQLHRIILEPPIQDEGMNNIPYTFEARLCYPYKTTTSSTIKAIAQNTFAPVIAKKTAAETQASAGPIQISLKAGESIRINTNAVGGGSTTTTTTTPITMSGSMTINNGVITSSIGAPTTTGALSTYLSTSTISMSPAAGFTTMSITMGSITVTTAGPITINGGTLNVTGTATTGGSVTTVSSTGTGNVTITGTSLATSIPSATVTSGSSSAAGQNLIVSGGTITIASSTSGTNIVTSVSGGSASIASGITVSTSSGTITPATVNAATTTTTTTTATAGTATMPLVFEVKDLGGGFATRTGSSVPCNPVVDKTKAGVLDVNVYIDGTQQNCAGTGSASSGAPGTVYIRNGVGNLYCTAQFNNQNPKTQYQIVATTDYNYYVTKDATISVSHAKS